MSDAYEVDPAPKRGGRPPRQAWSPTPVTDTPEFKRALETAVAAATKQVRDELVDSIKGTVAALPGKDEGTAQLFSQMALAIAEISDQGTNRKRVAPEILAQRAAARERMMKLIYEAKERGDRPEYRLIGKTYINERLVEPYKVDPATKMPKPVEIYFNGIPNEVMRPINDVAKDIYAAFRESIGSVATKLKGVDNRPVWVTAGGLVVKGDPPARREVTSLDTPLPAPPPNPFGDDLSEKNINDPTAPYVHVLGTVHPPARQNYQGQAT